MRGSCSCGIATIATVLVLLLLLVVIDIASALAPPTKKTTTTPAASLSNDRRHFFQQVMKGGLGCGATAAAVVATTPYSVWAFDNKISNQYDDRPKRRGSKPAELGVMTRKDIVGEEYQGLKHCGAAPNCFCSTDTIEDDPDHSIPAWKWPKDLDKQSAFEQVQDVLSAYEPGQSNIDGGGFKIVTADTRKGYIYMQFESLKNGYVDDLELAVVDDPQQPPQTVQVRSSSRIGYLDYGVNAKRINYIAAKLRSKGWTAEGVNFDTHRNYAIQNEVV